MSVAVMIDTDDLAKHPIAYPGEQTRNRAPTPAPSPRTVTSHGRIMPFSEGLDLLDPTRTPQNESDFDSEDEEDELGRSRGGSNGSASTFSHRSVSSKVRFDEVPVVIASFRNDSDPSSDMLYEDDFDELKHFNDSLLPPLEDGMYFEDSDSESIASDLSALYEFNDHPDGSDCNTRISWGPNVHLGARIQHERKRSTAYYGGDLPKAKVSNTLSTKDFDNLSKHNKLLKIYGISSQELKLLKGRRKAANKLGCIPMNIFDGPARSPRLSATPLKSALKPKRPVSQAEQRHKAFLVRKSAYEKAAVKNITGGECLIKYGPRGKPTRRWFCLSDDHSELNWGHSAKRNKKRKLALGDLVDVIPGKGFARFKSATVPPWLCITLAFTTRHLHLSCPNIASFMDWFLGLQSLAPLSSCNMTRGMLMWYRAIWKLDQQAAGIAQVRSEWVYPNEEEPRKGGTVSKRRLRSKKLPKMTW